MAIMRTSIYKQLFLTAIQANNEIKFWQAINQILWYC